MRISLGARKYLFATLAGAVIYAAIWLIDNELIAHHLRAEARYLDYVLLALVAVVFVLVLEDFHQRETQKLQELEKLVAEMNHHVRNALQVISYAQFANSETPPREDVRDSIRRIEWALREILGEGAARLGAQSVPEEIRSRRSLSSQR
jgi:exosortase/archaeosortase